MYERGVDLEENKATISNLKTYKLNKTFENSIYPLEQELKSINDNTLSSAFNNLCAAVFSGVGTSILFQKECIPKILNNIYIKCNIIKDEVKVAIFNIVAVILLFILLYFIGTKINEHTRNKNNPRYNSKKKKTKKGRSELAEQFHKSIINDIVIGLSFVDKSEELQYKGNVAEMYLYEAAYYFIQAKIEMEYMELLDPEKEEKQEDFIEEIGKNTIKSTCKVFMEGLNKLYNNLPKGTEKDTIKNIIDAINPYL